MYLSFICRGVARKHFTALLHYLCNHPYLEKYALPRPLKPNEKTARNNAIAIVVHSLYHVLWSFRCKFFNIRRKSKQEGLRMNVKAPQNAWTPDALMSWSRLSTWVFGDLLVPVELEFIRTATTTATTTTTTRNLHRPPSERGPKLT